LCHFASNLHQICINLHQMHLIFFKVFFDTLRVDLETFRFLAVPLNMISWFSALYFASYFAYFCVILRHFASNLHQSASNLHQMHLIFFKVFFDTLRVDLDTFRFLAVPLNMISWFSALYFASYFAYFCVIFPRILHIFVSFCAILHQICINLHQMHLIFFKVFFDTLRVDLETFRFLAVPLNMISWCLVWFEAYFWHIFDVSAKKESAKPLKTLNALKTSMVFYRKSRE